MGKKQKKSNKSSWKKSETAKEYEEAMNTLKNEAAVTDKQNKDLFFVDNEGSKRLRKVVFDDEVGEPMPKQEKLMLKKLKKELATKKQAEKKEKDSAKVYDIWSDPKPVKYDSKNFLRKEDFEISKKASKSARVVVKPNDFPAVPIPKAGVSYNPDSVQHKNTLAEQMELEVKLEEKIKKDKELPGNVTLAELHKKTITGDPMTSSLLFDEESEDEHEEPKAEEEKTIVLGPTVDKKIPQAKRRRMEEAARQQREAKQRKEQRRLNHTLEQSVKIAAEVDKEMKEKEEAKTEKMKQLEEERRAKIPAVIKGGKEVFEVPRVDVLLTDELTGDLRTMPNIVSPVRERYENIGRRHLVQTGGKKEKAKYERLRVKKGLLNQPRT
ncbi:hypothetical protein WA577_003617, partial [Blastocystis sp. JDR]